MAKKFLSLLSIVDDYQSNIEINDKFVYFASANTIQITQDLRDKFPTNNLNCVIRLAPTLLQCPKPKYQANSNELTPESKAEIEKYLTNTEIDLPDQLQECLILGIGAKAHSMGFLSNDPRTGTASVVNPYLERYELAVKKAKENGFVHQTDLASRKVWTKGFI